MLCSYSLQDNGGLEVDVSSQWLDNVQQALVHFTQLPAQKLKLSVLRCGGGYGGKLSRPWLPTTAVALAALKYGVCVRTQTDLHINWNFIGKRCVAGSRLGAVPAFH